MKFSQSESVLSFCERNLHMSGRLGNDVPAVLSQIGADPEQTIWEPLPFWESA